jgi:peptidoglycan biosynthesis protein MviN/MurJ (putative lipid II flippase)
VLVATAIGVPLTIALDLAFLRPLDQSGLALASAIAVYTTTFLTVVMLRRRLPQLSLRALARPQARLVACGAVGAGAGALVNLVASTDGARGWSLAGLFAANACAVLCAYAVATLLLARTELREAWRVVRSLRSHRQGPGPSPLPGEGPEG